MSGPTRFQTRTANYVIRRFWEDKHPAHRFLVADEVGLGKTVVARTVIEEALRRSGRPIDIVYLCSSQPVASQNLRRLKIHGHGGAARATRLTLLATEPMSSDGIRYFGLTPETSFKVTGRSGRVEERALIFRCLRGRFRSEGFRAIMQQVSDDTWTSRLDALSKSPPNPGIREAFAHAVLADNCLAADIRSLAAGAFQDRDQIAERAFRRQRDAVVGRLRKELALVSAEALASDGLVIVDEFQRFSDLLDLKNVETDFAVKLADRLLTDAVSGRRVLLLSATPYRLPGGPPAPGEKPYTDFVALVRFLAGQERADAVADALEAFSRALRSSPPVEARVIEARDAVQAILTKIMSRTERTGSTKSGDAMVADVIRPLEAEPADLAGAIAARRISRRLKTHDAVEFWKSAPYVLDFMRGYTDGRSSAMQCSWPCPFILPQLRSYSGEIPLKEGETLQGIAP